jgi:hypothetical protein
LWVVVPMDSQIFQRQFKWSKFIGLKSATYHYKALDEGYNFAWDLTLYRDLHKELVGFQSRGSSNFENFETPNLGVLGQNGIWMLALWLGTKNTIRGKVVVSLKSRSWWVLWIYVCMWFIHASKVLQLCINQLVIWFVQVRVNNWPTCHLF